MTSNRLEKFSARAFSFCAPSAAERLDRLIVAELERLAKESGVSVPARSQIGNWISAGEVRVDDVPIRKAGFRPRKGAKIDFSLPAPRELHLLPDSSVHLKIICEEASFLVLDKPAGLVVHPGAGRSSSTLVHGLLHYLGEELQQIGDALRPGLVHRLDKDTSGLMVVAKSETAYRGFVKQLRPPRTMERHYLLLASNAPRAGKNSRVAKDGLSGEISHSIGRSPVNRTKMSAAAKAGREALTAWEVKEHFRSGVLCEARLITGRTHQIRVHFEAAGAPLLGDPVYGPKGRITSPELKNALAALGRQALHAWKLSFLHPLTGERMNYESPLPPDIERLLKFLR